MGWAWIVSGPAADGRPIVVLKSSSLEAVNKLKIAARGPDDCIASPFDSILQTPESGGSNARNQFIHSFLSPLLVALRGPRHSLIILAVILKQSARQCNLGTENLPPFPLPSTTPLA
jgi:hypothetical protein